MSEKASIQELYMTARTATSLQVKSTTTKAPSDVLMAAGFTGSRNGLALRLWALMHTPRRSALGEVSDELAVRLRDHMLTKRMKGRPRVIARQCLSWWIAGSCGHCGGTGHERIPGTPHLDEAHCGHCNGTGKSQLHTANQEAADWLLREIDLLAAAAEQEIRGLIR